MTGKTFKLSFYAGLLLLTFILSCRFLTPVADFYSFRLYPVISCLLSLLSAPVGFSLQDATVLVLSVLFVLLIVLSIRKRWGWKKCVAYELNLLLWIYVWFYLGWCANYFRSDLFSRTGTMRQVFDKDVFVSFLESYTENLNQAYEMRGDSSDVDIALLSSEVRDFYRDVPPHYGLCTPHSWQHPKKMLFQSVQSASGVSGYMGPLFCEFHLNGDSPAQSASFTWAHEYAHLMGVSSEAEANWWAFHLCRHSSQPYVKYNAYFALLGYVAGNARRVLSDDEYRKWLSTLLPGILDEGESVAAHWDSLRSPLLDSLQSTLYNMFLKGNKISSGTLNYSEVVQLLISVKYE